MRRLTYARNANGEPGTLALGSRRLTISAIHATAYASDAVPSACTAFRDAIPELTFKTSAQLDSADIRA